MQVTPIPVLSGLSVENFRQQYFSRHLPVVIRGLFFHDSIAAIKTREDAVNEFGDALFETLEEYVTKFKRDGSFVQQPQQLSLRDYLRFIEEHPSTSLCVREYNTPQQILSLFHVPDLCRVRPSEVTSNLFVANAGNLAQLHFDGDHRHVLLYQVFGRKRAFIIPPGSSHRMLSVLNQGWYDFKSMSETDKRQLVAYLGGWEAMLHPGDALYFPMMSWHHLEYVDTGMSINFRFGRSHYSDQLYKFMHADQYVQNYAAFLDREEGGNAQVKQEGFERIEAALKQFVEDPCEKFTQMRALLISLCREIGTKPSMHLGGEEQIIGSSPALKALTAQPYHISNWLRLNGLHDSFMRILDDRRATLGAVPSKVQGVTATL